MKINRSDVIAALAGIVAGVLFFITYSASGQQLGAVRRVYSPEITNLAWTIDHVFVEEKSRSLVDPTGTLIKHGDAAYLTAVVEGMEEVLDAGSNAFVRAESEFNEAISNNPPRKVVHIKMISAPHTSSNPADRVPYGLLADEKAGEIDWYLSAPFSLKPTVVRRMRCLSPDGTHWTTNFDTCAWINYHDDRTNDTPLAIGEYPRTFRMTDAPVPSGVTKIVRDSHLHWGHPINGIEWGGMGYAVTGENGVVRHTLTGLYTARVDNVTYEFKLKNGATQSITEVE